MLKPLARISVATLLLAVLAAPACAGGFEDDLLGLINRYRLTKGLKPLASAPQLIDLAEEHSQAMQEQDRMSHDGFERRFKRAAADGASSCVENVAWNHPTPRNLLDGWRKSSGHNRNMLERRISRAGISKVGQYITFFACN